jgi:hypothetical protein
MTTVGIRLRNATVTAAVVLVTASGLTAAPAAYAATAPDPSSTAQPSPTPPPTTSPSETTRGTQLTLSATSALPGDTVTVSLSGWRFETCFIYYDDSTVQTGNCQPENEHASVVLTVPKTAQPNPKAPITACATTECTDSTFGDSELTVFLAIPTPVTSSPSKKSQGIGTTTHISPPAVPVRSTSGHSTALVGGGAIVLFIASAGLVLLRRRPPTIGPPPVIDLVPRPDPGVVTVDPAATQNLDARITIRLRPDEGHCRVEAMQR